MKKFLGITFTLLLIACSQQDQATEAFVQKVGDVFALGTQTIKLSELTDFEWDEACFFQYDDSHKYLTFKKYMEFLKQEDLLQKKSILKKAPYTNIILFLEKNQPVAVYGLIAPRIELSGKRYFITVRSLYPNTDYGKICNKATELNMKAMHSKKNQEIGNIFIFNEKETDDANND